MTSARLRDSVAEEVRVILARRRRTAVSVARELGWTQSYMAHRMTGSQPWSIDDLEELARELGVRIADLLPYKERNPSIASYATTPVPAGSRRPPSGPPGGSTRPAGRGDSSRPGERRTAPTR